MGALIARFRPTPCPVTRHVRLVRHIGGLVLWPAGRAFCGAYSASHGALGHELHT